ncbi:hypothetical protein FHR22_004035 [Sphingopyxis panaciterrae]|uniref:hypothetical protein n=1 Tax=Sphingopyxis panaciterrae TaxID=363841 RepID=UPI0014209A46|nr:hypothetical protein [Sphingopyxis panaciterrae]NIJ39288.1 hypothetical protein [Sphingopyxis panaciterrae]
MRSVSPFRITACAGLVLATATAAVAALPPYHQRTREIAAIVESREVQEALRESPIESIVWTGQERVQVKGGFCSVEVQIVDTGKRGDPPGPRKFKLKVRKAVCQ